jgi:hypothetical protein
MFADLASAADCRVTIIHGYDYSTGEQDSKRATKYAATMFSCSETKACMTYSFALPVMSLTICDSHCETCVLAATASVQICEHLAQSLRTMQFV